jgi:hypothetical protein
MADQAELAEAFAEAYSRARYGWSLAQYDDAKQRIVRAEAAGLLALARSGRMHAVIAGLNAPFSPVGLTVEGLMGLLEETANAGWDATATYEAKRLRAAALLARLNGVPAPAHPPKVRS